MKTVLLREKETYLCESNKVRTVLEKNKFFGYKYCGTKAGAISASKLFNIVMLGLTPGYFFLLDDRLKDTWL